LDNQQKILQEIRPFFTNAANEPFNYERFLCVDKAPYLDAFVKEVPFSPFELEIQTSSACNLSCRWCIGSQIQSEKRVQSLANVLNKTNIHQVVDGVLSLKEGGLFIDTVKFSGFIGDPLVKKETTLAAMRRLKEAGIRVGLFTNGVFLDEDTYDIISGIDYVHVSLDAGPDSFYHVKEHNSRVPYSQDTFNRIIKNIKGLDEYRKKHNRRVKINIGYVVIFGNHEEVYKTANIVKEAGADMIRYKCDIANQYTQDTSWLESVFTQIEQTQKELHNPDTFSVLSIHSQNEVKSNAHKNWTCKKGCWYQYFVATIGSDGNMYLCDHNTMPGAIPFGNAINESFKDIWLSARHKYLADGVEYICQSNVCPPFANRVNVFLQKLVDLRKEYGAKTVLDALDVLRKEI